MKPNPFEALPDTVTVNGRAVPINSDFRVGVSIEQESLAKEPDIAGLLEAFYLGNIPLQVEEAATAMIEFYSHRESNEGKESGGNKSSKRSYDFTQDADALLSSFLDTYGLDLSNAKIHWWTFRRLMLNLPAESPFMKRIYYRTVDMKKLSKFERKHVEKMRRLYALKAPERAGKTAEELDREFKEKALRRYQEAQKQAKGAYNGNTWKSDEKQQE